MKRLSENAIEIVNELHTERLDYESEYVPIIDALNRLAEYEDIGLEPEKIVLLKNIVDDAFSDKPEFARGWNSAIEIINNAPAADVVEVVHGRWIEEDGIQICSECGEEHEWEDYRAPYCDTCGAKMDGEGV